MVLEVPVQTQLDILLDRYEEHDRRAAKELLDVRTATDSRIFISQVRTALLRRPASCAFRFLVSLVQFEDIVRILLESYRTSKEEAISLAGKLQASDGRFDTVFLKRYADKDEVNWSEDELLAALEILDAVSERDRLVLGVSKFLRNPNQNIRSRAAKFLARRRPTLGLIADLAREADPVVRSGLIEGLYDRKEEFIPPIFREHIRDPYPSVAASALFGLYQTGDPQSISFIDEMTRDARPEFRVAAARLMGRTGDPRFSENLAALLSGSDEGVRRQALRGVGEMKRNLTAVRGQGSLRIMIMKHWVQNQEQSVWLTVAGTSGEAVRDIVGTKFLVKNGGSFVRKYGVEEYDGSSPLNLAFVLCEPPRGERSLSHEFDETMEHFCAVQRNKDSVTVKNLSHETLLRCYATDATSSNAVLTRALGDIGFAEPRLNLIVVGTTSYTRVVERLIEIGSKSGAVVHVIAVAPEWRTPELQEQVISSGGYFRLAEEGDLSRVCFEIYSALQHRYRIFWEKGEGAIEVEVRSESGSGTAVYPVRPRTPSEVLL